MLDAGLDGLEVHKVSDVPHYRWERLHYERAIAAQARYTEDTVWLGDNEISDYRVYVDKESRLVAMVFIAGDIQMRVTVNAADAQKLIDALTRAVGEVKLPDARH